MKKCLIFFMLILLFSLCSCKPPVANKDLYSYYRQDFYGYLDTDSFIVVEYDKSKTTEDAVKADVAKIEDILIDIEINYSKEQTIWMKLKNIEKSTVMLVNENSGISPVKVSSGFIKLLKQANYMSSKTNGGFDVTVGPLSNIWDIPGRSEYCNMLGDTNCEIPSNEQIQETLKLIDYNKIIINETESTVYLPEKGMALDFGAIAKGYAADLVMNHLKKDAYTYISVNLGGNVIVSGKSFMYNEYTNTSDIVPVGIENPYYARFKSLTVMNILESDITVVASGVSKRYIEVWDEEKIDYVKYHHIISPITGYPYDNEIETITIIGSSSMEADALSTGVFSLGLEGGIKFLQENNIKGIFITKDMKIYIVGNINYTLKDGVEEAYTIIKK